MKGNTHAHIIETASELFYKRGFNLTGINEIIEKSEIAKATLYSHFKSKEDILIAYLDHMDEVLVQDLHSFISKRPRGDKRIIGILEFLLSICKKTNFNGCWCIRTIAEIPSENEKVREKIKSNKMRFYATIESIISENRSLLSKTKRNLLSNQVYLLYEGAITESHLLESDWPIKTAISILKNSLKEI